MNMNRYVSKNTFICLIKPMSRFISKFISYIYYISSLSYFPLDEETRRVRHREYETTVAALRCNNRPLSSSNILSFDIFRRLDFSKFVFLECTFVHF